MKSLKIGGIEIEPRIEDGKFLSLGKISANETPLRNDGLRFLPWFDTYDGDVFRDFKFEGVEKRGKETVICLGAASDPDVIFRERRDSSGDICLRNVGWDAAPLKASIKIVLSPVKEKIGGYEFTGFKYCFEYEGPKVHRIADRQTWEVGGNLDDVNIVCRNWLTPPRMRIGKETEYSTVGLEKWAGLLPGNLWARWTLLPSFDMQYGAKGVMLGYFDNVSLIRTVIESAKGEDRIRFVDLHYFENSETFRTNPKTILFSPSKLDHTDALNLWTEISDRECQKACAQFGIEAPPAYPPIVFSENVWKNISFDTTYDNVMKTASEFGADYVFIDPIWEHGEAFRMELQKLLPDEKRNGTAISKYEVPNMCCTLDFEVAEVLGGEKGLRKLCNRAAAMNLKIISWMATHYMPHSVLTTKSELGHGANGILAAKESGRHPDTGYPTLCCTANLNAPIADKICEQVLGVCKRTGLSGFLWDSFSNLGWWSVDYSKGDMRPQFDKMAALFATLVNAGLYIQPEGILTFSKSSCCGLHGGNVYAGDLLGYSMNSVISLHWPDEKGQWKCFDHGLLTGEYPVEELFKCVAHKRIPNMSFQLVPREKWRKECVDKIKELLGAYRRLRGAMVKRTVLKDDAGVMWDDGKGKRLLFSFKKQKVDGKVVDAVTGKNAGSSVESFKIYSIEPAESR